MRLAIFCIAVCVNLTPATASEDARAAATTILRVLGSTTELLSECSGAIGINDSAQTPAITEADQRVFTDLYEAAVKDNAAYDNVVHAILGDTEYRRIRSQAIAGIAQLAVANQANFLYRCRLLPAEAQRHAGVFAPLSARYPAEMRVIDEWR